MHPAHFAPDQSVPQSTFTSEYTPRSRTDASETTSSNVREPVLLNGSQHPTPNNLVKKDSFAAVSRSELPEGPPPHAPTVGARIEIEPGLSSLRVPGTTSDGQQMTIYHVDPTSLAEKPWRKPGSDLSDWFNFGFDEMSWKAYGQQKREITSGHESLGQRQGEHGLSEGSEPTPVSGQESVAMMQMMNGSNIGTSNFNPQMMAQMPPQQQMQFMNQMMANGGAGIEAMMAPFLPSSDQSLSFTSSQNLAHPMLHGPGMGGPRMSMGSSYPAGSFGNFGGQPPQHIPPFQQQQQPYSWSASTSPTSGPASAAPSSYIERHERSSNGAQESQDHRAHGDSATASDAPQGHATESARSVAQETERRDAQGAPLEESTQVIEASSAQGNNSNPAAAHLPNPAGMQPEEMTAFLGMSGVDVPPVANPPSQSQPLGLQGGAAVASRGRGGGLGVAGAPKGPSGMSRGGRPSGSKTAVIGTSVPSGPAANTLSTSTSGPANSKTPPTGPSSNRQLPPNVPTGPRNPGKRYNDRDGGSGAGDALDYGGGATNLGGRSRTRRSQSRDTEERLLPREESTSARSREHSRASSQVSSREQAPGTGSTGAKKGITIKGRHESIMEEDDQALNRMGRDADEPRRHADRDPQSADDDTQSSRHRDKERVSTRDRERNERKEERRERRRVTDGESVPRTRRHHSSSPESDRGSNSRRAAAGHPRGREDLHDDHGRDRDREERQLARASRRAGKDKGPVEEEEVGPRASASSGTNSGRRRKRGSGEGDGSGEESVERAPTRRRQ